MRPGGGTQALAAGTSGWPKGSPDEPRRSGSEVRIGRPDETGQAWCLRGPWGPEGAARVPESDPKLESKSLFHQQAKQDQNKEKLVGENNSSM